MAADPDRARAALRRELGCAPWTLAFVALAAFVALVALALSLQSG